MHPGGTFIVGDSTTYRVSGLLRERAPDWYLDYHWGRSIKALPQHVKTYLKDDPHPSNFVMALGINWCHDPEWSEARLRRAIRLLPPETNVFLVMVVRAGRFHAEKDRILQRYNRYSRNLARSRPPSTSTGAGPCRRPHTGPREGTSSLLTAPTRCLPAVRVAPERTGRRKILWWYAMRDLNPQPAD